jgi:DNA gyrase subunit A
MRVVIDLKRDAVAEVLLNQLYKHTPLQESFGVNMLAIVDGRPKLLNLRDALLIFLKHRREVIVRRTVFELRKAEERLHSWPGSDAVENMDLAITIIRRAMTRLRRGRSMNEPGRRGSGLTYSTCGCSAHRPRAGEDLAGTRRWSVSCAHRQILGDEREVSAIVVEELRAIRDKYGDDRRTRIVDEAAAISVEDLIVEEDMVVTISNQAYVKRNPVSLYRAQRRGGRGKIGAGTRDEDFVEHLFVASTHSYLLFFTTTGKVYWLKVHEIPQAGRAARGRSVGPAALKPRRSCRHSCRCGVPARPLSGVRHPTRSHQEDRPHAVLVAARLRVDRDRARGG